MHRKLKLSTQVLAVLALSCTAFGLQAQTATTPAQVTAATPDQVSAAFQRADSNQDGKLSKEEAARLPAVAERFDALDKNKDGYLTADEFNIAFETAK